MYQPCPACGKQWSYATQYEVGGAVFINCRVCHLSVAYTLSVPTEKALLERVEALEKRLDIDDREKDLMRAFEKRNAEEARINEY